MEIFQSQKELHSIDQQIHTYISQKLKEIKTIFVKIYHQNDPLNVDPQSDSIDSHLREICKKISINQKKVLKAYIHIQLQDAYNSISLNFDLPNKREKDNFFFFPNLKHDRISPNQNKLLELFRSWFLVNLRLTKGLIKRKEIFLKELSDTQGTLNLFFERIMYDRQQSQDLKKEKHCEVSLVLILILQFNLCVLLLYRRNYSSMKLIIDKFRLIFEILKKQNSLREEQILENLTLIEQLHKQQEQQVKQYLLKNRINSLRSLNNYKKFPSNKENHVAREIKGEEIISQKFNKAVEAVIQKNKKITYEHEKINIFLLDIQERMIGLENFLLFQTETDEIEHKITSKQIKIRLFQSQRLNSVIQQLSTQKDKSNKIQRINELIFNQKTAQTQDIFLQVLRNKNSLDLNIKDYFNLCLYMKKAQMNKEAIIYFQILVFQFRKKNLITNNCLKGKFLEEIDYDDLDEVEKMYVQEQAAVIQLEKFIRNQQLFKIMMFSLVNLIQLYEISNAHYWALQTLNYTSKLIQFKVIRVLETIKSKLNSFQQLTSDDQISNERKSISKQQNLCMKLIKKYSIYLQEIKFKIIKCSFNSLTSQIIHRNSLPKKLSKKKINLRNSATQIQKIPQTTIKDTPIHVSYNMKRLKEKQNQLQSLIQSRRGSLNSTDRLYQTGRNSPKEENQFNKASELTQLKQQGHPSKKPIKGNSYQIKKKAMQIQKVSYKKGLTKNSMFTLQNSKKPSLMQKSKQTVKFNLSTAFQKPTQSCANIKTYVSIGMEPLIKKTINFLDTQKTLDESKKSARIGEQRKKLLQNKEELQNHIKLCFMKLNGYLTNAQCSTIFQDDFQVQNHDFSSKTEEVLNEFNEFLSFLKGLRSNSQDCIQREILIDAKIKLLQIIKPKQRNQKLIEVCVGLVNDISLLKNSDNRLKLKKKILWQLSSNYQAIKDMKKAISTYLQLARLGDSIGYLKIGQIYMKMKDYGNSIKYYEKYATQKNFDLSSKVKLAHAYSKVPQYNMKTIDMLSGILIATGTTSKFRQQIIQRKYDDQLIESAVILLSSLHFKNDNIDKAIELCENYCRVNIKNYRVVHILGGYYRFMGNMKKSFQCYLNALQNNPTHHKSLIELTEFICQGHQYKAHAIQLLRKCFCIDNKNFQLVKTLVKFLLDTKEQHDQVDKDKLDYQTLLKYAEIFNQSHKKGYSGQNFYEQASLLYEWALSFLDKSVTIANLDQIEEIYHNLGSICLKKGDYARSESYYKLYLAEIQKYVNRSQISQQIRQQKINKTKIFIYHFLGKVKKQQGSFKKAITYFNKSQSLQLEYHQKLPNLESYFYLFEVGYCYFMLESYENALRKFNEHRDLLLYLIAGFDDKFFKDELSKQYKIEEHLDMREKKVPKKKVNYLRQLINGQNQTSQTEIPPDKKQAPEELVEYVLKKNYFQNQLYTAFCSDIRHQFIQSKEIYKKVLSFIKDVEQTAKNRQKMKSSGKKDQLKDQSQKARLNYIKHITSNYTTLNADYKGFKKISMINLANIYRIEGLDSKQEELRRACFQEFPQSLIKNQIEKLTFGCPLSTDSEIISSSIKGSDSSLASGQAQCMKVYKTSLDNLDWVKSKRIHFADQGNQDNINESPESLLKLPSVQGQKCSF